MDEIPVDQGVRVHELQSWRDFGDVIGAQYANSPAFLYRGQAEAKWKIESTLDRLERRFPQTPNFTSENPKNFQVSPASREEHLEAFKEAVRGKGPANSGMFSENEWWALAQHHGLATPLIDWAYSPFVALFFAFEHEGYVDSESGRFVRPEKRVVHVVPFHLIVGEKPSLNPAPTVFSPRRELTNRLSSQSGVLMRMPKGTDLESIVRALYSSESTSSNRHARPILTKIVIPNSDRIECLKFLNKMNINRMSLFPDLDGAAKYINDLWELHFDTALGRLPDGANPEASTDET